ncbi:tetratricopeptide repeat protein [Tenacibaculum jejuense]|uniref:Tetratricopeptide repeat protein n=1 Tax=Tenacibaculum jejuense TaxID=584609 RepID=A0A238U5T8_9FLAO|nr:hypothetical protein [Tenacibaculum jejuense]SNR13854.1 Protein of unknown function precursor [Tenacibaculum jejuense]
MLEILFCFLFFISQAEAQDNVVLQDSIPENKLLDFEKLFFDAITSKAINNHQKAIEQLEECNTIIPNEKAVLFELSKNYFLLKKIPEAVAYANQALKDDPENIWIQEHLVKVHRKSGEFEKAIEIQEKIGTKFPKKKRELPFLYLMNNERSKAKKILNELADAKLLNGRLRRLKSQLEKRSTRKTTVTVSNKNQGLRTKFNKDKSFKNLTDLLEKLQKENNKELLSYSEQGLALFPAQPLVYLMNGIALNNTKQYKKAIETLKNGIDFVIDDRKMEKKFYVELLKAYKGTGDTKNINKYQKKIK